MELPHHLLLGHSFVQILDLNPLQFPNEVDMDNTILYYHPPKLHIQLHLLVRVLLHFQHNR